MLVDFDCKKCLEKGMDPDFIGVMKRDDNDDQVKHG